MNILLLSPWFPSPPFGGALIRVYETLRYLSSRHRVTLVAPLSGPRDASRIAPLEKLCERVVAVPVSDTGPAVLRRVAAGLVRAMPIIQGLHRYEEMARHISRLTARNAYDIIHVEHSFMAPYLASVSRHSGGRTVLSMHNIESLRFHRELHTMRWSVRRLALLTDGVLFDSWERAAIRQFDGIAVVSGVEEDWVRHRAPDAHVAVVPNGVDIAYFAPAPRPRTPRTVVFSGLMNYPPNIDAVVWFCDAVLPSVVARHPEVRFVIVGDKPTSKVLALGRRPRVEVTGRVPDVRPYLAESAAVVVPLRSGAGTRLKILEAMAMGRPVVSTGQGAEGLKTTHGLDILIGDTPQTIADHLCTLIESSEIRERFGRAGRQLVEQTYGWSACLHGLDTLYQEVAGSAARRALNPVREAAS